MPQRRADRMRWALRTPMPGTLREGLSRRCSPSTGKRPRWLRAQEHLGSTRGLKLGVCSSSSSPCLKLIVAQEPVGLVEPVIAL